MTNKPTTVVFTYHTNHISQDWTVLPTKHIKVVKIKWLYLSLVYSVSRTCTNAIFACVTHSIAKESLWGL